MSNTCPSYIQLKYNHSSHSSSVSFLDENTKSTSVCKLSDYGQNQKSPFTATFNDSNSNVCNNYSVIYTIHDPTDTSFVQTNPGNSTNPNDEKDPFYTFSDFKSGQIILKYVPTTDSSACFYQDPANELPVKKTIILNKNQT